MLILALWRPFLDPLPLNEPWHPYALMPLLVFAVALVYKALKLPELRGLMAQSFRLALHITALMILAAAVLCGIVAWV